MEHSDMGSFLGGLRRALLPEAGEILGTNEAKQGNAQSLLNAGFTRSL